MSVRITNCYARTIRGAIGPVTLCADVRIQPDERHRYAVVTWDYASVSETTDLFSDPAVQGSDPFMNIEQQSGVIGSAEDDLDGASEPIRPRPAGYKMLDLSGGSYNIQVSVFNDREKKRLCGRASARVIVR